MSRVFYFKNIGEDRLNVFRAKRCGSINCEEMAEPNYGKCQSHLNEENNLRQKGLWYKRVRDGRVVYDN